MARPTREQVQLVQELVRKYADMLDVSILPRVVVRDHLTSRWLGRCSWRENLPTTTIELQRSILAHPQTLERVVAHEMVHHADLMSLTPQEVARIRAGFRRDGHGERFRELSAVVNAQQGDDFVTETSDESYVVEPSTKNFYLLILPLEMFGRTGFGYAYAVRMSPKMARSADRYMNAGAKLVLVNDSYWAEAGPRIGQGIAIPNDEQRKRQLVELFKGVER